MIVSVNHTSFTVADMDRSITFYRDNFGMKVISDRIALPEFASRITGIPGAKLRVVYMEVVGYWLEFVQYLEQQGPAIDPRTNSPGAVHFCFDVDDIDRDVAALRARGVPVRTAEPVLIGGGANKGGRNIFLSDPDGITIELLQRRTSEA